MNPFQSILLSHNIYWSTALRPPPSRLLVIRYLPNLLNMTLVAIVVILIKFRQITVTRMAGVSVPCSVLFAKWNFLFEYSI